MPLNIVVMPQLDIYIMTTLFHDNGVPAGALYNHILLLTDSTVAGVLLGHCVFDWSGKARAKYFNRTLYTLKGTILAKEKNRSAWSIHINGNGVQDSAWDLIMGIHDHYCPFIEPTENWAGIDLSDYFLQPIPALDSRSQRILISDLSLY